MKAAIILSVAAFVIGSIPSGLIIARLRGVDLKAAGSGNIGATNVLRTTGKWPALLTLLGDIAKGSLPVVAARYLALGESATGIIGLCAVMGHNFSIFLKGKGGKGVATSIGVLLIYAPKTCIVTIIIWLMTVLASRYSSLGALVAFGSMPFVMATLDTREKLPAAAVMSAMLFIRHKDNIVRLLRGTEGRIGKR